MSAPEQQPPRPPPGPPLIPANFPSHGDGTQTQGYVLNHVGLQISSPASSLAFYVDFLGMSLVFTLNAGPFTAYYLGYRQGEGDATPADIARTSGVRSGLLELIKAHDDDSDGGSASKDDASRKESRIKSQAPGRGFAHLGYRVPDVAETLRRAEEKGWKVFKALDDLDVRFMPLPSWERNESEGKAGREGMKWEGGFEKTFAQIGFVQDPDGNWIEILPREMKRG